MKGKQKRKKTKWGKIGPPHSATRKAFLAGIRKVAKKVKRRSKRSKKK